MCKISSHLKLCTCSQRKILLSDSYWILYRWKKSDEIIVGEPVFPDNDFINPKDEDSNKDKLLTILNSENCFDFEVKLKNKDSLEINIKYPQEDVQPVNLIYAFVFMDGIWKITDYDSFDLERLEIRHGIIQM